MKPVAQATGLAFCTDKPRRGDGALLRASSGAPSGAGRSQNRSGGLRHRLHSAGPPGLNRTHHFSPNPPYLSAIRLCPLFIPPLTAAHCATRCRRAAKALGARRRDKSVATVLDAEKKVTAALLFSCP